MSWVKTTAILVLAFIASVLLLPAAQSVAACDTLPQDKGRATYTISVTEPGTYTLWARMAMQAPDHDSVLIQLDSQCPVNIGDKLSGDSLQWVNYRDGNPATPTTTELAAGTHAVTIAGREAGAAVDKIMFIGSSCTPEGFGDNCLADTAQVTPAQAKARTTEAAQAAQSQAKPTTLHILWIAASALAGLGALAFMITKFIAFERTVKASPLQIGKAVVGGEPYASLHIFHRLRYFARHHWLAVALASAVIVASVVVGVVAAARPYPVFEAESGTLAGGAKVVDRADASGGKIVRFDANPQSTATTQTSGGTSAGTPGGTTTGGGSTGGGSTGGGTGACATTTQHVPDGPDGMGGCWPGASNTGVPSGVTLGTYTGPCTITTPNTVIDSKQVNCQILVRANNLTIKNSRLTGGVSGLESDGASFTIQDSNLDNGVCSNCSVDGWNSTILRTEITGSNRGIYCMHVCYVENTWVHGTALDPDSEWHASAIRAEQYTTLKHNVLACDWTGPFNNDEIGCSADMSGYPDFVPIHDNTIDSNLFRANPIGLGFCAYGGGTNGKPYSGDPLNATNIVFKNNIFERGSNGKCGTWGAITDYLVGRTGNQWLNNKWTDGATVDPE